jgi:hypothetical protein
MCEALAAGAARKSTSDGAAIATRTEVIELVTCRSGRIGRSAGSVTVGKDKLFDENGFVVLRGNHFPSEIRKPSAAMHSVA